MVVLVVDWLTSNEFGPLVAWLGMLFYAIASTMHRKLLMNGIYLNYCMEKKGKANDLRVCYEF